MVLKASDKSEEGREEERKVDVGGRGEQERSDTEIQNRFASAQVQS